jgi:preprotein translocase subunit SecD
MTLALAVPRQNKVGLAGLFLLCAALVVTVCWIGAANAQPLLLEVQRATAEFDQRTNEPIIRFTLKEASRKAFADFTTRNVGRKAELRVDGRVLMRPVIREPILGGSGQISGGLTVEDATTIAGRLSSGAAKIEVEAVTN